jgi:hypothetical protein
LLTATPCLTNDDFREFTIFEATGTHTMRKAVFTSLWRYLVRAGAVALVLAGIAAAVHFSGQGSEPGPDLARSKKSGAGLFLVSIRPETGAVRVGGVQSWLLTVKTRAGKPVINAAIDISGGMPRSNRLLPTSPQATAYLGGGHYRIERIKFDASGWWQMRFTVSASNGSDTTVFNLML